MEIKVGYLVSYDYEYIKHSLPTVYKEADKIAIAIDKNRETWNGGRFEIPDSFFEWIKEFDKENKIQIYEDTFFVSELSPVECDTRERNMLARFMGEGGWHIQVDSDEYFLDFKSFIDYIKSLKTKKSVCIFAEWITIFKFDNKDFLLIDANERFPLATNKPIYTYTRSVDKTDAIYTKYKALHQSWGRNENEMKQKLSNWSHSDDFNTSAYFDFWKVINRDTYKYIKNFHPIYPYLWKELECVGANNIPELIETLRNKELEKKDEKSNSIFGWFRKRK